MRARTSSLAGIALSLLLALAAPVPADTAPEAGAPAAAAPASPTTELVDSLHAGLLECMRRAEALGYQGRYELLTPLLESHFDLAFMAEKSIGRYWRDASPEEQAQLVDAFRRHTIATYAGRFHGFSGQRFETRGEEPSARGTVLVHTRLHDPEDDDVTLDYRLRESEGSWRIIDVYLNGTVSELALRRSEYSSLIKREGLQALIAALDERIQELAETPASSDG